MAWQSPTINPVSTSPATDISKITNDLGVLKGVIGGTADAAVPSVWTTPGNVLAQSANSGTTGGTSTAYTLTPSSAIAAYTAGQTFWVTFHAASGATPTLAVSGLASPPNLVRQLTDGTYANIASGEIPINHRSRVTLLSATQALVEDMPPPSAGVSVLRGYLAGLTMSTAGASTTMTVAPGQCADSANAVMMSLAASTAKTTSVWAVGTGNGGLDTGSISASTWYYFYAIRRPDTGVVDVVFSTSSSAPTLPTNYTQYRYLGAGLTNGSSQWVKFTQFGDDFYWDTPVLDFSSAGSTTASLQTLTVPRGRKVKAALNVSTAITQQTYLSDPSNADLAPSTTVAPLGTQLNTGSTSQIGAPAAVWTNTSAQIRHRESATGTVYLATLGWTDLRDRMA